MVRLRYGERDSVTESALTAMNVEDIRDMIHEIIPWLDPQTQVRVMILIEERAVAAGWTPPGPSESKIQEIEEFSVRAKKIVRISPGEMDTYLREGTLAFLARDYAAAFRIFRSLLKPLNWGDFDLGQEELFDEVLGVDLVDSTFRYVVAMYMTASPKNRVRAVCSAIKDVRELGFFMKPLEGMERVSVEPLPEFKEFAIQWREQLECEATSRKLTHFEEDWLYEARRYQPM